MKVMMKTSWPPLSIDLEALEDDIGGCFCWEGALGALKRSQVWRMVSRVAWSYWVMLAARARGGRFASGSGALKMEWQEGWESHDGSRI